ncbi:hypothetical protein AD940_01085 [Gluconobacter thailandicus]|uniref:baseplate assembly protein n=1 Tax=Gluconobacter thailandicus TaxID=257438 RepID=UPI0007780EB9|nr:baseplate J/gp47 family protein [Gluconobacter thailandicus]KXV35898.1 hypothetical protein AD940_01085 [Gluconobacter thailandicus]
MTTQIYSSIDLASLPAPQVIINISAEDELSALLADFSARYPDYSSVVESDPVRKLCEAFAYRLAVEKQARNDAFKAVMLAYAKGSDLDQIGANYNVSRLMVSPANPNAIPPTAAVMEKDDDFRARIQLSFESYSTAGSTGGYAYFAKSASAKVLDVQIASPTPGDVVVYILSTAGDGTASSDLIETVSSAITSDDVRPLTDNVSVKSAEILPFSINAVLTLYPGPDAAVVIKAATEAAQAYADKVHRIGYTVATSGLYAALQQSGVEKVALVGWNGDITSAINQAPYCTGIDIKPAGVTGV